MLPLVDDQGAAIRFNQLKINRVTIISKEFPFIRERPGPWVSATPPLTNVDDPGKACPALGVKESRLIGLGASKASTLTLHDGTV